MAARVKEVIESQSYESPTEIAIREWLNGNTVALKRPQNWPLYRALRVIHPEFSDFDIDKKEDGGKFHSDYLFTTVRQGIMRYLAACKNQGKGPKPIDGAAAPRDASYKTNLTPEIQATMDFFVKDISEDYVAARVTSTSRINKLSRRKHIEANHPDIMLSKGVVVEKPEVLSMNELSLSELLTENEVFDECFRKLTTDYAEKRFFDDFESLKIKKEAMVDSYSRRMTKKVYLIREITSRLDKELKEEDELDLIIDLKKKVLRSQGYNELEEKFTDEQNREKEIAKEISNRVIDALFKSEIDDYYHLEHGTMLNLMNTYLESKKAVPKIMREKAKIANKFGTIVGNSAGLPEKEFKEAMREANSLNDKLQMAEEQIKKDYSAAIEEGRYLLESSMRLYRTTMLRQYKDMTIILMKDEELIKDKGFIAYLNCNMDSLTGGMSKDDPKYIKFLKENNIHFVQPTERKKKADFKQTYISRQETYELLKNHNLESLMPYLENNFLLEKQEKPSIIRSYVTKISNLFKKK
jgi:hypothetical protein